MTSLMRWGTFVCVSALATFAGAPTASAQEQKADPTTGQKTINVFNKVEGRTTILTARIAGTRVTSGELVCELDPSDLKEQATNQGLVTRAAEAAARGAKMAREVAEMA